MAAPAQDGPTQSGRPAATALHAAKHCVLISFLCGAPICRAWPGPARWRGTADSALGHRRGDQTDNSRLSSQLSHDTLRDKGTRGAAQPLSSPEAPELSGKEAAFHVYPSLEAKIPLQREVVERDVASHKSFRSRFSCERACGRRGGPWAAAAPAFGTACRTGPLPGPQALQGSGRPPAPPADAQVLFLT